MSRSLKGGLIKNVMNGVSIQHNTVKSQQDRLLRAGSVREYVWIKIKGLSPYCGTPDIWDRETFYFSRGVRSRNQRRLDEARRRSGGTEVLQTRLFWWKGIGVCRNLPKNFWALKWALFVGLPAEKHQEFTIVFVPIDRDHKWHRERRDHKLNRRLCVRSSTMACILWKALTSQLAASPAHQRWEASRCDAACEGCRGRAVVSLWCELE